MGDSDAEWVGVDFEFGKPDTPRTTPRPVTRKPVTRRPVTRRPVTRRPEPRVTTILGPHDAPEIAGGTSNSASVTVISVAVGGVLCSVLLVLLVYMLVLRKRLNKAKGESTDSQYQLRVEDVAHLTHLDETSNTYVNTTDLQKLLSSVRAKNKAEERPPTMPKIQHQTPTPYRSTSDTNSHPSAGHSTNTGFTSDPDVVIVRAPMPVPHDKTDLHDTCKPETKWKPNAVQDTESLYSNIEPTEPFKLARPPSRKKVGAPAIAPPPPPTKPKRTAAPDNCIEKVAPTSPTVIARPAPPPPALAKTKSVKAVDPPKMQKPLLPGGSKPTPLVAPNPNNSAQPSATAAKPAPPATSKPTAPPASKPTPPPANKPSPPPANKPSPPPANKPSPPTFRPAPPVASKPGVSKKAKGLPPLKMALLPSLSRSSLDNCTTPDTGIIELTPENTPTPTGSISSKIAFLEGKMKTPVLPTRALTQKT